LTASKPSMRPWCKKLTNPSTRSPPSISSGDPLWIVVPLVLTLVSIYLGFSWTDDFQWVLSTNDWLYTEPQPVGYWFCPLNGKAVLEDEVSDQTVWDTNEFLDITLGFGLFDFGVAKGLDIGWDLIVGRGGQLILALLSYRLLSATLLYSMETCTTSFYTYTAVGFDRGPLFVVWAAIRDLWIGKSQDRRILSMIIFASVYLLAFPTFVSGRVRDYKLADFTISRSRS
jgi:hypothetical protein